MREVFAPIAAFFIVTVALVAIAVGISQSAPYVSYVKAYASAYTVIFEQSSGFSSREATFVNSDHQLEKLGPCARPGIFGKFQCTTSDGSVVVHYGIYKSRLRHVTVEVSGELHELRCERVTDGKNARTRACMSGD